MNTLRNVKLKTKLLTAFLFLAGVTLVVGLFGVVKIRQIDAADEKLYTRMTVPLSEINDIAVAFQRSRVSLRDIVDSTDPRQMQADAEVIRQLRDTIESRMKSFEQTIITEDARRDFGLLMEAHKAYVAQADRVLELDAGGREAEAKALLGGEAKKTAARYQELVNRLVQSKIAQAKLSSDGNMAMGTNASLLMIALVAAGLAASIGLGLLLTREIMDQLGEDPAYLDEVAGRIAGGDLDVAFRPQKKQGGVYHVLQGMVATMKAKIAEAEQKSAEAAEEGRRAKIAADEANEAKTRAERARAEGMMEAADQLEKVVEVISSASEQLSAQVEQSSRGAEQQSARVAETATAMEEMNSTVLEVARNAARAAEDADAARKKAGEGSAVVARVVEGIGAMQEVSVALKQDMGALGRQAEGIGQVMGVISDIADQTNLLALNAAIEAARAGDAGRGFAVVADEVRKLAEKTMAATKEVEQAILGIQQGARKNMDNVDRAVATVEQATGLANESGRSLTEIVGLVEAASDQVRSIATASEEQSATSEEINRSVDEINRISSETADAMRQSAQAVGELAGQTQNLRGLIEKMKSGG
jgi:methyl-accepting chemotaxis protein